MQPLIPYFQTIQINIPLPDFFPRDSITLFGFGVMVALGILLGARLTIERGVRQGLPEPVFRELLIWVVLGVVVGGHIGYGLFYHPKEYFANPILFLHLGAGLSSFGGFIFSMIAITWVLKKHKQPYWKFMDNIAIGFSLGWFFGRMGCTLNHEHPGTASNFFLARFCRPVEGWTIEFPQWMLPRLGDLRFSHCIDGSDPVTQFSQTVPVNYEGVVGVHDMGLYEALFALTLFISFKVLDRKPRFDGFYSLIFVSSYVPLRFAMDFLRPLEGNARYAGLTPAQWGCIGFGVLCIWAWTYFIRQKTSQA